MDIGKRIEQIINKSELSRKEIAERLGITIQGLSNLIGREDVRVSTLVDLAKALEIHVVEFFIDNSQFPELSGQMFEVLSKANYEEILRGIQAIEAYEISKQTIAAKDQLIETQAELIAALKKEISKEV